MSTSIAPTSAGFAYSTCESVVILDGSYEVVARRSHEVYTPWSHVTNLAAHDDTVYGVILDRGAPVDELEEPPPPLYTLFAVALDGTDRFRQELGTRSPGRVITAPGGYYLDDGATLRAFDSGGAMRWMSQSRGAVATDGAGGLVSVTKPGGPVSDAIALERIDADGASLWSKTWTTSAASNGGFIYVSPFAGRDGGIAVTGQYRGNLNLGDRVLPDMGRSHHFVARLKPDGSTAWAFTFAFEDVLNFQGEQIIVLNNDRVVLTGLYTDAVPGNVLNLPKPVGTDAFVIVFDGSGNVTRTIVFGGEGDQYPNQIMPLVDGTIAIGLGANGKNLQVGSTEFSGYASYVVTVVP